MASSNFLDDGFACFPTVAIYFKKENREKDWANLYKIHTINI